MNKLEKKNFVKPELIRFDKPLDEVTLCHSGSGGGGQYEDQGDWTGGSWWTGGPWPGRR